MSAAHPAVTGATTGSSSPAGGASSPWPATLGVLIAAAGLRLVIGARLPLVTDESYYWEWSRRLAPGYFDHPPAIALLIRGGTRLVGDTPLGVRLLPQMAGVVAILACVLLAARLGGAAAARRTAIVSAALPVASLGLVLATPDAPLLAMTALTLVAVERAVTREPDDPRALRWWVAAGILLGLAFLSKYTAVLIPLGVLVALLTHAGMRRHLARPGPYLAGAIAIAVFLPVAVWNARHGWVSFSFQLHHGLGAADGSPARRELRYVAALALLASPILLVLLAGGVWHALRARTRATEYLLATVATTWAAFFAVSALRHGVEANWAAPALLAAVPLVGLVGVGKRGARWLQAGVILGLALTAVACVGLAAPAILPLAARRALARNVEAGDLARRIEDIRSTAAGDGRTWWIAADRYQEASELAFTLPGHPRVFSLSLGSRSNQYAFWPALADCARAGDDVVLVLEDRPEAAAVVDTLRPYFERVERVGRDDHAGAAQGSGPSSEERPHQLWVLHRWRGGWPRRAWS